MGFSTDALLMYGYNLGGDDGWKVEEADKYGGLCVDWYGEDDDFEEVAMDRILAAHGFTVTAWEVEDYSKRRREAEEAAGVQIEAHCSANFPLYVLTAKTYSVSRGEVLQLDLANLMQVERDGNEYDADARLLVALAALELTPLQAKPAWLMASYWSG